jgi:hypothetical protein
VLAARDGERCGVVDGLRRVQVGPPGGKSQLLGGGAVLVLTSRPDRGEQVGG